MERHTRLPSGLVLVETVKELAPELAQPVQLAGIKCGYCDRRCTNLGVPLLISEHTLSNGFTSHTPTCRHGRYVVCPECKVKYLGCPICRERCEYT